MMVTTQVKGLRRRGPGKKKAMQEHRVWDGQAEMELLRHACRKDFWTFFLYAFGAWDNPKGSKWIDEAIHRPLAEWFQERVEAWEADRVKNAQLVSDGEQPEPKQHHLAVVVHREIGKTTLITRAGQLWLHLRDPEIATAIGAEKMELSAKMLQAMLAVMDGSDEYALWPKLYGNWSTAARKWTGKEIVHAGRRNTARQDPSFVIFGVETSITGSHPDAYFYDDPISYERLRSDANWLGAVNSQVSSLIPVIQGDGLIVWVGTRYDDNDHMGVAFGSDGVASLSGMQTDSITVDPEHGRIHVYFMAGRDADNKPTTPKVWPENRLSNYQRTDPIRYAAQIMNDPAISEHNPITRDQIQQCGVDAKDVPWNALRFAITFDTAFAHGEKRLAKDESGFIVHGYPRNGTGDVYICEVHGSPAWRAEDFCKKLVTKVQLYRSQGRKVFALAGDLFASGGRAGALELALRNFFHDAGEPMPAFYEFNRNKKGQEKITRIVNAATFWVDGHVRWVRGAPGIDKLLDQMAKIGQMMLNPKMKDDYVDMHADAFQPELYQAMRIVRKQIAPWEHGASPIDAEGFDREMFNDDEEREWRNANPRAPLRGLA